MYKHILIATDGSELADKAVAHGLALASALKTRVTAITVTEPLTAIAPGEVFMSIPVEEYENGAADVAAKILQPVRDAARHKDVACETVHVANRFPAEGILETAKTKGCDLIVMASHGRRGLTKILLGSQAAKVLTYTAVPVLVCR